MSIEQEKLRICVEHIYWDVIEVHGIARGRKNELTFVSSVILNLIVIKRLRMQDIAAALDVSRSTVTDYVNYLETRGYVARVRSDRDRRDVYVEPTGKGLEWVERMKKLTFDYVEGKMKGLTSEEQQDLIKLIMKFVGDFEQSPASGMLRNLKPETPDE